MNLPPVKLQQGQVWKCGGEYVRIVQLGRREVGYKSASNLKFSDGQHQLTSKKDFCRLLKGATLLAPSAGKILTAASADGLNVPAAADRRDRADAVADQNIAAVLKVENVVAAPNVADDSGHNAAAAPKVANDSAPAENGAVHPPDQTPAPPANN